MTLPSVLADALAVVFPVRCAGCGAADRVLCPGCRGSCHGQPVLLALPGLPPVASSLRYEGVVREAILGLKERGRTDVVAPLAPPLAAALSAVLAATEVTGVVELVTVPPRRAAIRRRGFDPLALLMRRAGLSCSRPVLRRVRQTEQQKSLDLRGRSVNLLGSLEARGALAGRRLILVDDVVTTGATLREAVRALELGGAVVIGVATLAWTPRHSPLLPTDAAPGAPVPPGALVPLSAPVPPGTGRDTSRG